LKYFSEMQFTPAKKNGAPVPIWAPMELDRSVYVR
jgi:hypothetical protein